MEILQHDRETHLENLGVGQARVRHVRMHGRRAVEALARRRARADRLVILVIDVAEGEVVHRALRGAELAERGEKHVRDGLARLDIAGDHRRRIVGRQHRARG